MRNIERLWRKVGRFRTAAAVGRRAYDLNEMKRGLPIGHRNQIEEAIDELAAATVRIVRPVEKVGEEEGDEKGER